MGGGTASADELYPASYEDVDSTIVTMPDDHSALTYLNEPSILDNTAQRYNSDQIYTYTGRILIALNPFRQLEIYGPNAVAAHKDVGRAPMVSGCRPRLPLLEAWARFAP